MSYTEFGEYFRILRIKHHEVLNDAKKFLGVSTAFISSVECGKKKIPDDWEDKIIMHYNLNEKEQKELRNSIEKSKKELIISWNEASAFKKDITLQFQRSFDDLDDETMVEIQKILEKRRKQ